MPGSGDGQRELKARMKSENKRAGIKRVRVRELNSENHRSHQARSDIDAPGARIQSENHRVRQTRSVKVAPGARIKSENKKARVKRVRERESQSEN